MSAPWRQNHNTRAVELKYQAGPAHQKPGTIGARSRRCTTAPLRALDNALKSVFNLLNLCCGYSDDVFFATRTQNHSTYLNKQLVFG